MITDTTTESSSQCAANASSSRVNYIEFTVQCKISQ